MGEILDDFEKTYGKECLEKTLDHAGEHSTEPPPVDEEKRLVFALLEILDFDCCDYGCYTELSPEEIKKFLLKHKKAVLEMEIPPPSALGAMLGVFSFLLE